MRRASTLDGSLRFASLSFLSHSCLALYCCGSRAGRFGRTETPKLFASGAIRVRILFLVIPFLRISAELSSRQGGICATWQNVCSFYPPTVSDDILVLYPR